MFWVTVFLGALAVLAVSDALEIPLCIQIRQDQIFDGNSFAISGNSDDWRQVVGFKCNYTIAAPRGLFAKVTLQGQLTDIQDNISVTKMNGKTQDFDEIPGYWKGLTYFVLPGANMSVNVVIWKRYATTNFKLTIEYHSANYGPVTPLKTNGEMNFLDVFTLRENSSLFSSVTYAASEPIVFSIINRVPLDDDSKRFSYENCFIIDGTIDNNNGFLASLDWEIENYQTTGGFLTIVTFTDFPIRFGFDLNAVVVSGNAVVVSGPPNNSSKVLLDFSTNPKMPHFFNAHFTVISNGCLLRISVQ